MHCLTWCTICMTLPAEKDTAPMAPGSHTIHFSIHGRAVTGLTSSNSSPSDSTSVSHRLTLVHFSAQLEPFLT